MDDRNVKRERVVVEHQEEYRIRSWSELKTREKVIVVLLVLLIFLLQWIRPGDLIMVGWGVLLHRKSSSFQEWGGV